MTEPGSPNPASDPVAGPAGAPPAGTANVPVAALSSAWRLLDRRGQIVVAGGIAVAVIALVGSVVGSWSLNGFALVALVAGLAAALVAFVTAGGVRTWPIAPPYLEVATGLVAAALALLNLIELLFDLDQLDEWGGPIGALLSIALVVAAIAVLAMAAVRSGLARPGGWLEPRPVQLATIGAALSFIGPALGLSIGVLAFSSTVAFTVTATLLAFVAVRAAAEPGIVRLPFPAAWLPVALAIVAVLPGLDLLGRFLRSDAPGALDWLYLAVHLAGMALVVAASLLSAGLRMPPRVPPTA